MSKDKDDIKEKEKEESNVVDLWGFRIRQDMKKREEEIRRRDESSDSSRKKTINEKIKKALEKYGSFKGTARKKKKDEDKK